MSKSFTHTHLHTKYSVRDAITDPEALMRKCAEMEQRTVGVTDHGTLAGMWECAKYAKKYGVKLIPGNEVYIVPDVNKCRGAEWSTKGKSAHLVLLAVNQEGWRNLLALTTRSSLEGFYCQPRVDYQMLREHSVGVYAQSACLGGVCAKAWRAGNSLHLLTETFKEIYGDRFSLEIQLNTIPEQMKFNEALMQVAKDTDTPLVATVDSHYLDKADSHKQDLVFCLGMDKLLKDPDRHRYPVEAHSVESSEEVYDRFVSTYGEVGRQAVQRTVDIADVADAKIEVETRDYKIPSISIRAMEDYADFSQWAQKLIQERGPSYEREFYERLSDRSTK